MLRLEAVAAVRSIATGDAGALAAVLDGTDDPRELAHALAALGASLLVGLLPEPHRGRVLDGWTEAAIAEGSA